MKCPFCTAENTQVMDTRENEDGDTVRRRRRCLSCDKRFTTYERAEMQMPALVKKNGTRSDYAREKLRASMQLALRKRPVTTELVEAAVVRIEEKLAQLTDREIPTSRVGELVMRELKKLDKIAYIRFASVYRNFEDVDEFSDVIREVQSTPRRRGNDDAQVDAPAVIDES
ncbi:MAG: transcriptional repressor NrdR [Rhodocyclaceae bacterium]|nr:transcriptional repressor NrdR [Rhodocyclaceae bacterium]